MPELPEVEAVCRSLVDHVTGRRVVRVDIRRADIVTGDAGETALLRGRRIHSIRRHGKQIALLTGDAADAPCLCVHLGMTGSLCRRLDPPDATHCHITWRLDDGSWLVFRDPRRFGGIWTFPSPSDLAAARWSLLGDDALSVTPARLYRQLQRTRRAIKTALLDQNLLAGLGNIYVDELLFRCGIHPLTPANAVSRDQARRIVPRMRTLLRQAIAAGGSTTSDFVNADGHAGVFQTRHRVYGRAGLPCRRCGAPLETIRLAGRTTVFCTTCQRATASPTVRKSKGPASGSFLRLI